MVARSGVCLASRIGFPAHPCTTRFSERNPRGGRPEDTHLNVRHTTTKTGGVALPETCRHLAATGSEGAVRSTAVAPCATSAGLTHIQRTLSTRRLASHPWPTPIADGSTLGRPIHRRANRSAGTQVQSDRRRLDDTALAGLDPLNGSAIFACGRTPPLTGGVPGARCPARLLHSGVSLGNLENTDSRPSSLDRRTCGPRRSPLRYPHDLVPEDVTTNPRDLPGQRDVPLSASRAHRLERL